MTYPATLKFGRLLILDDDAIVAETIAGMAAKLGFDTLICLNATEFFARMQTFAPTHAIIDLSMPDVDGFQVMRLLGDHCPARIIIASGSGNRILEAARRVGTAHGLDIIGILHKPFRSAHLNALLMAPCLGVPTRVFAKTPVAPVRQPFTRDELIDALGRDEFTIYLQPKVRCKDSRIVGFESLARWHHPLQGLVMSGDFTNLFEEYGLEAVWMEKLIGLVTSYLTLWLPSDIHLSLNMSMSERSKATIPPLLTCMNRDLGAASGRIVIEVVENGLIDATPDDIEMFARLRLGGFQLSIDDFGSGFSSLSRLVRIPFSELKIDRSFVQEVSVSKEARSVVRSVVAIGHSLDMSVTAEGVEDLETLDIVKSLGCDTVQGFVYSRAVPIEQVMPWIEAGGYLAPAPEPLVS